MTKRLLLAALPALAIISPAQAETRLQPGMTFAVDGGISVDGVTAGRIGDSIVVTENGCEYLTEYPREILLSRG